IASLNNGFATWIWTDVLPASGLVPAGSQRAFRKTFIPTPGETPASTNILIAADDEYTLYVNGVLIGSASGYSVARQYIVNLEPAAELMFAVLATNGGTVANHAGLLVSIEISMAPAGRTNCTAGATLVSDATWKSTKGAIPSGFQLPGFDDSTWPMAVSEAAYGAAPWGH
ncbi:hypothetical protein B0H10DRAFT_1808431, partial [Mycena sp. CBHHK59/15]